MEIRSTNTELTGKFPFLKNVNKDSLDKFMQNIHIAEYPPGTVILEEGSACKNMVFILSGTIRVYKLSPEGREITLYRLERGETCVLLISCLMGNKDYSAIAEVEDTARLAIIPAKAFQDMFYSEPSFQKFIFDNLSQRLQEVLLIIDEIVFKRMDKRVAEFLIERLSKETNGKTLEITHEKIAAELGTAREVVSRVLKDFERKGFITLSRGKIQVLSMELINKIQ